MTINVIFAKAIKCSREMSQTVMAVGANTDRHHSITML